MCQQTRLLLIASFVSWQAAHRDCIFEMPALRKKASVKKGNTHARRSRVQTRPTRSPMQLLALQMVLPHAPVPVLLHSPSRRMPPAFASAIAPAASALPALPQASRPLQMTSPHALPHAHRADRPIKTKPPGRRNPPANEAVTKWRIIETLERATPEEISRVRVCSVCSLSQ